MTRPRNGVGGRILVVYVYLALSYKLVWNESYSLLSVLRMIKL